MGKVKNREFWESATMNNLMFKHYYDRLTELAISMFEWKNVPETIDVRFLELSLFGDGACLFFEDKDVGLLALRYIPGGGFTVYDEPIERRVFATNGYTNTRTPENSVCIYNNMIRTASSLDVEVFAKRLYNLDRAVDINANAQKTPILIQCPETQRLTMKNLYKNYTGNEPVIFGDNNLNPNGFKVLKTDAPFVADRLYNLKSEIWNEALTYLGISHVDTQKKERMISSEVSIEQGGTLANRFCRLASRKLACEKINKMFNVDIDCEYRSDIEYIADMEVSNE